MRFISFSLIFSFFCLMSPIAAQAEYFTVREVETKCRNRGKNAGRGAGIGVVVGCGIGLLLGGRGRDCARGAVEGAVVGGFLGLAASCEEEVQYVTYWDEGLEGRRVSQHYERWGDHCDGRVLSEGYNHRSGYFCREYETIIHTRNGDKYRRTVACHENGYWRHGYESHYIESRGPRRGGRRSDRDRYDYRSERRGFDENMDGERGDTFPAN